MAGETVRAIGELSGRGLSATEIAPLVGWSRRHVQRVLDGEYTIARQSERGRCPQCRQWCWLPCLLCLVRREKLKERGVNEFSV